MKKIILAISMMVCSISSTAHATDTYLCTMHYEDSSNLIFVNMGSSVNKIKVVVGEKAVTDIADDILGTNKHISYSIGATVDKEKSDKLSFYMSVTNSVDKVNLASLSVSQPVGISFVHVAYNSIGLQLNCELDQSGR